MSDSDTSGFGKFVPGFDFLQNLAKGASGSIPQMPGLGSWIAPTLNPQELDKRIDELKAVHFWLEQNSRALSATIQALEVQKMTLATLKGMNVSMGEVAEAMKFKPAQAPTSAEKSETTGPASEKPSNTAAPAAAQPAALVDPLQLWGSLTQQFQQIATAALKDATSKAPAAPEKRAAPKRAPAKKTPAAKTARKKPVAR